MLITTTTMNANFKLAPLSCHCKLNMLVQHLKKISAQKAVLNKSDIPVGVISQNDQLFLRYI